MINPIFEKAFEQGYDEGFAQAVEAHRNLSLAIFAACIAYWIGRAVLSRIEVSKNVRFLGNDYHITSLYLQNMLGGIVFTVILAISGFKMYYLIF